MSMYRAGSRYFCFGRLASVNWGGGCEKEEGGGGVDGGRGMNVASVQNLDPLPDPPCHGRHFLDNSYLIQQ